MLTVGETTPYNALYGRQPRLLPNLPSYPLDDAVDTAGHDTPSPGLIRHVHRLREIAVQQMVEATAAARVDRALGTLTRVPIQAYNYEPGDQVEFWEKPAQENTSGWHGPATVIDVTNAVRGNIVVKWLKDYKTISNTNIRKWMSFVVFHFLSSSNMLLSNAKLIVHRAAAHYNSGRTLLLGWLKDGTRGDKWFWANVGR